MEYDHSIQSRWFNHWQGVSLTLNFKILWSLRPKLYTRGISFSKSLPLNWPVSVKMQIIVLRAVTRGSAFLNKCWNTRLFVCESSFEMMKYTCYLSSWTSMVQDLFEFFYFSEPSGLRDSDSKLTHLFPKFKIHSCMNMKLSS